MMEISLRVSYTLWSEVYTFTPSFQGSATAHSGSRKACSVKGVV